MSAPQQPEKGREYLGRGRATSPATRKPNEPAHVVMTARHVAGLRDVSYEALEATVDANAARVFGW